MNLSDSLTAGYPDTWLRDARSTWLLILTGATEEAAAARTPEHVRSLHVLIAQLCAQHDRDQWESVLAATYLGLGEASGNRMCETLLYDLWQTLATAGAQWDVAAQLWPVRGWAEETLRAVVRGVADGDPVLAQLTIRHHLGGVRSTLDT